METNQAVVTKVNLHKNEIEYIRKCISTTGMFVFGKEQALGKRILTKLKKEI